MNIEEGAPGPLIQRLGDRLGYVHVNESHRGYLGTGSIDFDALFRALADHKYKGVITFEAFASGIGDPKLNADLAVWRPLWDDPDDLARHARTFMQEMIERASTPSKRAVADAAAGRDGTSPTPEAPPSPAPPVTTSSSRKRARRSFGWARQSTT
jgi:hypothetical protein